MSATIPEPDDTPTRRPGGDPIGERGGPLLSIRVALVVLLALLAGLAAAGLTILARRPVADAVLFGIAGFAAGLKFFHWLIA